MEADDYRSALEQSWIGGSRITHRNTDWLLSKPTHFNSYVWTGHFGYVREDDFATVEWDEESSEFLQRNVDRGTAFPFMVDTSKRLLSIQSLGHPAASLIQRLTHLLNDNGVYGWEITPLVRHMTFQEWSGTVAGVTKMTARLDSPNPKWKGKPKLEELITQTNSRSVRLEARSFSSDFIDLGSDWGREVLDHVSDGYGTINVVGTEVATAEESKLKLERSNRGSTPETSQVPVEGESMELPADQMRATQESVLERYIDGDSVEQ